MILFILGVVVMAGVIYLFLRRQNKRIADVIRFEADAEKRAKWKLEQAAAEQQMQAKIDEFRERKKKYEEMKERLKNDHDRILKNSVNNSTAGSNPDLVRKGDSSTDEPKG